jgi:hypothetical protein
VLVFLSLLSLNIGSLARSDRAINSSSAHYSSRSPPAAGIQFQGSVVFRERDLRVVCFPEHFGTRNLKSNQRPTLPHTALKQLTAPENYSRQSERCVLSATCGATPGGILNGKVQVAKTQACHSFTHSVIALKALINIISQEYTINFHTYYFTWYCSFISLKSKHKS